MDNVLIIILLLPCLYQPSNLHTAPIYASIIINVDLLAFRGAYQLETSKPSNVFLLILNSNCNSSEFNCFGKNFIFTDFKFLFFFYIKEAKLLTFYEKYEIFGYYE